MRRRRRPSQAHGNSLDVLVGDLPDAVLVITASGAIAFLNPAAEDLFGRDAGELLGYDMGLPITVDGGAASVTLLTGKGAVRQAQMRVARTNWNGEKAWLATLRPEVGEAAVGTPAGSPAGS